MDGFRCYSKYQKWMDEDPGVFAISDIHRCKVACMPVDLWK